MEFSPLTSENKFLMITSDVSGPEEWQQKKRNYKQLIETTTEIGIKVGVTEIVQRIHLGLKD